MAKKCNGTEWQMENVSLPFAGGESMTIETTAPPATDFQPTIVQRDRPLAVSQRLVSLDIFRGITIAAMLLVNNAGKGAAYGPLEHAEWHGWTPTDLIFPFFVFIVGVATPFSLAKRAAAESDRLKLLGGIWLRALSIVLLGALQGIPFSNMDPLPEGFLALKLLRIITWVFCFAAILAILYPWKSPSLRMWIVLGTVPIYLLLAFAMYWTKQHAIASGLPEIFSFGNGLFAPQKLRIPGVLQRIGICYGVAASIALFSGWRTILFAAIVFMAGFSALMLRAPYHDHATGSLTEEDNLAGRIDLDVFGKTHVYTKYGDPEGLLSTLPATATALLGILVGIWLSGGRSPLEKCAALLANGVWICILGVCLHSWLMPINKKIWTPSFVIFTAGMAMLGLGMIYWIADVRRRRAWALPFKIYGVNAIAAFVIAGIVTRIGYLVKLYDWNIGKKVTLITFCQNRCADGVHRFSDWLQQSAHLPRIDTSANISLTYAIGYVLVILLIMSILYAFKILIKV
jgi:predicted acyltransferase